VSEKRSRGTTVWSVIACSDIDESSRRPWAGATSSFSDAAESPGPVLLHRGWVSGEGFFGSSGSFPPESRCPIGTSWWVQSK